MKLYHRLIISIFSIYFLGIILSGCATIYNSATGKKEMALISTRDEVAIGKNMARQIEKRFKLDDDAFIQMRIGAVGNALAQVSDRKDLPYYFKVLEDNEINAFTTPGGYIYVFRGLVDKTDSDGELASVIAHEIAHVAARHAAKKMEVEMGYGLVMSLAFSRKSKPEIERYINIGFNLISLGYSREDEMFADKLAIQYVIRAGYNPYDMILFMEKLDKIEKEKGGVPIYLLRSHPYMRQRIDSARKEIALRLRENEN